MKPTRDSSTELLARINRSDRRLHHANTALVVVALGVLLFLAVLSIYSQVQVHKIIEEHYQRTEQINHQFSNQFNQIEQALKEQDNYFTCRINLLASTTVPTASQLATCTAPFNDVKLTADTSTTTSSSSTELTSSAPSSVSMSQPSSTSSMSPTSSSMTTQPAPTSTSTVNPQPADPVITLLQGAGSVIQETAAELGNLLGQV